MSDKQKAVLSLTLVQQSCNETLAALAPQPSHQTVDVLHKDLVVLCTLLRAATTKLSLALKPSSPTYSASLSPLKDLADHVFALFHCANMFDPTIHGTTLVTEIVALVRDAIESIRALVQTFLDVETNDARQSSGQAGDEYMVRTAAVHSVLDKARELPTNNLLAVRKRWSEDAASIDDGLREVGDMVEDAESPGDSDDTMFDDGWDELGLGEHKKMDPEELARSKQVHGILRLSTLLHKRILSDVLSIAREPSSNTTLDTMSSLSHALLSASDELVSTLYTPQDSVNMDAEVRSFRKIISDLQASVVDTESLETQLEGLSLGRNNGSKKWFDACFVQIFKALDALVVTLRPT
ncbi:hypothetical protein B0H10DRAFT_855976 [Mycena sp. CBHHK59/15]|nr:hypothetical protein B0H10DRAFT_855976 [Mycena sp. CBHHK59/15]